MAGTQSILLHLNGVEACKEGDFLKAVAIFQQIPTPPATILFNIGCCYLHLEEYEKAETSFKECIRKDKYLVVGYFQLAVTQIYRGKNHLAAENFLACHNALRGNKYIDYKQLNMNCKISDSSVRLNLALAHLFTGDLQSASDNLRKAVEIVSDENSFIHVAAAAVLEENWEVFGHSATDKLVTLSADCLFRPSKAKLDGLKSDIKNKNSAKVVSATDDTYSFVGFVGPKKLQKQRESEAESVKSEQTNAPPIPLVAPPRRVKPPQSAPPPPPNVPPPIAPPSTPPPSAPTASTAVKGSSSDLDSCISEKLPNKKLPSALLIPSPPSTSPPTLRRNTPPLSKMSSSPVKLPPFPTKPPPSHPLATPGASPLKVASPQKLSSSVVTQSGQLSPRMTSRPPLVNPLAKAAPAPPALRPPPPKVSFHPMLQCDLTVTLSIPKAQVKSYNDFTNFLSEKLNGLSASVLRGSCEMNVPGRPGSPGFPRLNEDTWKRVFVRAVRDSKLDLQVNDGAKQQRRALPEIPTNESTEDDENVYVDANLHVEDDDEELYTAAVFSQ